jgi:hypothetical protein
MCDQHVVDRRHVIGTVISSTTTAIASSVIGSLVSSTTTVIVSSTATAITRSVTEPSVENPKHPPRTGCDVPHERD